MSTYRFKTKPYAHQREGIKFAFKQFRQGLGAGFFFEPRTGKTKTTIDTMSILAIKEGVRKVLVIAPNRVLGVWVQELHVHCPLVFQAIVWDARERAKGRIPQPSGMYDLQVLVVNYEAFATPGKRTASGRRSRASGRMKIRQHIRDWVGGDDALIVVDESHKIKNPSGKASNLIVSMRPDFKYRLILTGTPITKARRAADVYMQWRLINPSRFSEWGATYEDFRNHTGKWIQNNGFPQWVKAIDSGMRDLQRGIHEDAMIVRRNDCFDLPPTEDRIIPVKLTTSAKHYDEMAQQFFTQLKDGDIAEASIPMVVALRLSQITSGHVGIMEPSPTNPDKLISRSVSVGVEKYKALGEILAEETIERDEKVVIVARWKADLDAIEKMCKALGMAVWSVRGGMTRETTDDAIRRFKRHSDGPAAMVVQPQAGGVGIDLSTASTMIWYSLTSSWVDYTQMRDRIALSRNSTTFIYLIATGTIDELMLETLKNDGDVAKRILTKPESILRRTARR